MSMKKVLTMLAVATLTAVPAFIIGTKVGAEMVCWADCECEEDCDSCCRGMDNMHKEDEPKNVEDLPGGEAEE